MSIKRLTFITIFALLVCVLFIGIAYQWSFTWIHIADITFVIGIVMFFPALIVSIGANQLFNGFNYSIKKIFSNDFRHRYQSYSDFLDDKQMDEKSTIPLELMTSSILFIAISIFITQVII